MEASIGNQCTHGADAPVAESVRAQLTAGHVDYRFMSRRGEIGPFLHCR
jgi:hypothetical protein